MITIHCNNEIFSLEKQIYLSEWLEKNKTMANYAIAINKKFVPRAYHSSTLLCDGDVIDIIIAMQGG